MTSGYASNTTFTKFYPLVRNFVEFFHTVVDGEGKFTAEAGESLSGKQNHLTELSREVCAQGRKRDSTSFVGREGHNIAQTSLTSQVSL